MNFKISFFPWYLSKSIIYFASLQWSFRAFLPFLSSYLIQFFFKRVSHDIYVINLTRWKLLPGTKLRTANFPCNSCPLLWFDHIKSPRCSLARVNLRTMTGIVWETQVPNIMPETLSTMQNYHDWVPVPRNISCSCLIYFIISTRFSSVTVAGMGLFWIYDGNGVDDTGTF